jgi:TP901 family phage tail tape measure protein
VADRSITIRLKADVRDAIVGIKATSAAVKDFSTTTIASAERNSKSWDKLGKGMVITGALILGGLLGAAHAAAEFDHAMSGVAANIDDKSVPSLERLRQAALLAGQTSVFSATEAADAENELAKAGLSSAQIVGGALTAALTLASAGQLDLATSAEILSATLVQYSLSGEDAAHVADVLSAGADKSLGGVQDLGEGLKYAGVNAAQFGLNVDDTVGVLAEFASRGVLGSMAGTSLRQMFVQLAAPTQEAAGLLSKYNIAAFDAQGKFVGLSSLANQLQTNLGGLTDEQRQATLSIIFGARSLSEANILYQDGAQGVMEWRDAVNDSGFAAQQAATKLDNLDGDVQKLKNTFNVALIDTGEEAQGALRGITQEATGVIAAFDALSPTAKGVVSVTALVIGGVTLLGGAFLIAVPKVVAFATALKVATGSATTGAALKSVAGFLVGPWGIALAAGTIALGAFAKSHIDSAARVADLTHALEEDNNALGANTRLTIVNSLEKQGLLKDAKSLGVSITDLTQAAEGNLPAQARVNEQLNAFVLASGQGAQGARDFASKTTEASVKAEEFRNSVFGTSSELSKARDAAKLHAEALGDDTATVSAAQSAGHQLTQVLAAQGNELHEVTFDVTEFDKALKALFDQEFGVEEASDKLAKGYKDLAKQVKGASHATHTNSAAALANRDALRELVSKNYDVVAAYAKTGATADQVKTKSDSLRDAFVRQATKAGFTKRQIQEYVTALDAIPATVNSEVTIGVSTHGISTAARQLGYLQGLANKLAGSDIGPGRNATGTDNWRGGLTWVGERGMELVDLPAGSKVYPNGTAPRDAVSMAAAPYGGGSGPALTVQVTAPLSGNPLTAGERVGRAAQRVFALAGG